MDGNRSATPSRPRHVTAKRRPAFGSSRPARSRPDRTGKPGPRSSLCSGSGFAIELATAIALALRPTAHSTCSGCSRPRWGGVHTADRWRASRRIDRRSHPQQLRTSSPVAKPISSTPSADEEVLIGRLIAIAAVMVAYGEQRICYEAAIDYARVKIPTLGIVLVIASGR